tara:strand:+ start:520 stop:753 length:234 start_codon:yes stop_codon:yes gene_type:complete
MKHKDTLSKTHSTSRKWEKSMKKRTKKSQRQTDFKWCMSNLRAYMAYEDKRHRFLTSAEGREFVKKGGNIPRFLDND